MSSRWTEKWTLSTFLRSHSCSSAVILALTNPVMETGVIWIGSSCLVGLTYFEDVVTMCCVIDNSCGCSNIITLNRMWVLWTPHVAVWEQLLCICAPVEVDHFLLLCFWVQCPMLCSLYLQCSLEMRDAGAWLKTVLSWPDVGRWYTVWQSFRSFILQLGARRTYIFALCLRQFPPLMSL